MTWSLPSVTPSVVLHTATELLPSSTAINAGLETATAYAPTVARNVGLVSAPVSAASRGLATVSPLTTAARFLGRTLGIVVVGTSIFAGVKVVKDNGYGALIHSRQGRAAVLGAVGGSLLLVPTPATQLGGAAVLTLSAVNEFGLFKRMDHTYPAGTAGAGGGAALLRTT